jgi:hypothetical protein
VRCPFFVPRHPSYETRRPSQPPASVTFPLSGVMTAGSLISDIVSGASEETLIKSERQNLARPASHGEVLHCTERDGPAAVDRGAASWPRRHRPRLFRNVGLPQYFRGCRGETLPAHHPGRTWPLVAYVPRSRRGSHITRIAKYIDILKAARRLLWKYGNSDSPQRLPRPMLRRLKAMMDLERAQSGDIAVNGLRPFSLGEILRAGAAIYHPPATFLGP